MCLYIELAKRFGVIIMTIRYTDIQGFFGYAKLYEEIVEKLEDGSNILELGSFRGRSTSYLLELSNKSGKSLNIFAVDHFKGSEEHSKHDYLTEFTNNMNNLEFPYPHKVVVLDSEEAATQFNDNFFDFIMIDASHDYENIKKDINVWLPKVKKGGIFAGDDYDWFGVSKAVNELLTDIVVSPRAGDCCTNIYAGNYWVKYNV